MTESIAVPAWLVVLAVLAVAALGVALVRTTAELRRSQAHTAHLLAAAASDADALRTEVRGLQDRLRAVLPPLPVPKAKVDDREYVITELAEGDGPRTPAKVLPAPLFADVVLRESVIRTASLAVGLRRALSPEVLNRVRFEMRREVKRSRKARKLMLRAARRDWEERQRAGIEAAS